MTCENAVIIWKIRCFNTQSRQFFDRRVLLDTSTLSAEDKTAIMRMVQHRPWDRRLANYRPRFTDPGESRFHAVSSRASVLVAVHLPDYFEDEHGKAMGRLQLVRLVSGEDYPVIVGDPTSVLALGPSPVKDKGKWLQESANKIARFLQVAKEVAHSKWLKGPLRIRWAGRRNQIDGVLELVRPEREAIMSVCHWVRQLYSRDNVLNLACNAYLRHVADRRKRFWVQERKKAFNTRLRSTPGLFRLSSWTTREILDAFIYGSGLTHAKSERDQEHKLKKLLTGHGAEPVVAAFNFCCRELCQYALDIYPVMKQDFEHWIRGEGCAPPTWPELRDLLP